MAKHCSGVVFALRKTKTSEGEANTLSSNDQFTLQGEVMVSKAYVKYSLTAHQEHSPSGINNRWSGGGTVIMLMVTSDHQVSFLTILFLHGIFYIPQAESTIAGVGVVL
jgi:hypothetical protein